MTDQQKFIKEMIKQCEEVMQDMTECEACHREHQHLKECLELTLEVLPILDVAPLEEIKSLVVREKGVIL